MPTRTVARWSVSVTLAIIALAAIGLAMNVPPAAQARPHAAIVNCSGPIQACINTASDGDTIVVAAGAYTESLTLSKPVSLTGVSAATTIIHAAAGQRVLTVTGSAISSTVIISGLTFTGGNVSGGSVCPDNCGGGILITDTAQPSIQHVVISGNRAYHGGGLYAQDQLTLTNVRFISNTAVINGGGAFIGYRIALYGVRFERNQAINSSGGGLFTPGYLILSRTEFISNTAGDFGGGASVGESTTAIEGWFEGNSSRTGGGLSTTSYPRTVLTDTQFIGNNAEGFFGGGGLYSAFGPVYIIGGRFERNVISPANGGGVYVVGLHMSGTQFVSNTGKSGGGAYTEGEAILVGGRFQGNLAAAGSGGGVFVGAELAITGTQFISNAATTSGGGVSHVPSSGDDARIINALFARNTAGGSGAALSLGAAGPSSGEAQVLHTTIADTSLNPKQAIVAAAGTVYITNTIIASHTIGISQTGHPAFPPAIFEDYNLFFGVTLTKTGVVTSGGHSLIGNPLFLAPASDNYHLRFDTSASAAIDAGVDAGVTRDVDGDSRPIGSGFDIGYDEWTGVFFRTYLPLVLKN